MLNKNKHRVNRTKVLIETFIHSFCVVWIFAVFFLDYLLHGMPGIKTLPRFFTQLINFLTALFSGTYTP